MQFLNNWQTLIIKLIIWYISRSIQCNINFWLLCLPPKWNASCKKNAIKSFHQKLGGNLKPLCVFGTASNAYIINWIKLVMSNSRSFGVNLRSASLRSLLSFDRNFSKSAWHLPSILTVVDRECLRIFGGQKELLRRKYLYGENELATNFHVMWFISLLLLSLLRYPLIYTSPLLVRVLIHILSLTTESPLMNG